MGFEEKRLKDPVDDGCMSLVIGEKKFRRVRSIIGSIPHSNSTALQLLLVSGE